MVGAVAVAPQDRTIRAGELRYGPHKRLQDRFEVEIDPTYRPKHFGGRSLQLLGIAQLGATQHALNPCQQFARFKWLGDVIVRTRLQAHDAIYRIARGSHQDDANPATALTQPAHQREPVFAWEPDVEHD
jgi:hypothetical protein